MEDGNGWTAEYLREGKDWEKHFKGIARYFGINPSMSIVVDGLKGVFKAKEGDTLDLYFNENTIYIKKTISSTMK